MRVKFTLIPVSQHKTLHVNYNYFLTGLIYKIIKNSSEDYSQFLHNEGYRFPESKKGFKLFTYSMLMGKKAKIKGETISFGDGNIHWYIASPVDTFIQHFITGVFAEGQEIKIGQVGNETCFLIKQVETLPEPQFSNNMRFTCLSPITISKSIKGSNRLNCLSGLNGSKGLNRSNNYTCHYIRPWEYGFSEAIKNNLIKKHNLVTGKEIDDPEFTIKIDEYYMNKKNGKITKNINFKGTNIIGFIAPFEVNGNPELIEIGYETGFGEKGSMGFGMVKESVQSV
ncbi:MAG: CRISPR-associated protein [Candidatus Scalindua rubra]|uniref:CRISPR-associated protein n=1 Tax=Candidatus Scalindua rubra TaxID=1872076 RepID=A0A1E3X7B4_9BACT|nr:MAG: CRISPR-associated protein [Candidatus Scalindua rubra]